jgi:Ni/Fe-hydrogenase subunit HybB-like protein
MQQLAKISTACKIFAEVASLLFYCDLGKLNSWVPKKIVISMRRFNFPITFPKNFLCFAFQIILILRPRTYDL